MMARRRDNFELSFEQRFQAKVNLDRWYPQEVHRML